MDSKSTFKRHLSVASRSRLILLRDELLWLLEQDEKFGFDEEDISYRLGPCLMRVLSHVWFSPLRTVARSFRPIGSCDVPRVFIREDIYEGLNNRVSSLDDENKRLRASLGLKNDDDDVDLPF